MPIQYVIISFIDSNFKQNVMIRIRDIVYIVEILAYVFKTNKKQKKKTFSHRHSHSS